MALVFSALGEHPSIGAITLFTEEELSLLNPRLIPEHVAIIMDGNRRWAKRESLQPMAGHWRGADALTQIVKAAGELGVKVLTVYAFSTENWKRPSLEVKALLRLLKTYLLRQTRIMVEGGIRFRVIGDVSRFPVDIREVIEQTLLATAECNRLELVVGLNYGARDEIKRAVQAIAADCLSEQLLPEAITEKLISSYLDTAGWKDPDLLIRTSGESRVSNFLLWQISYSEVVLTETLWPDFGPKNLLKAILEYQKREVRKGT